MEVRKALPVHHTETSSGSWDGPANEARLRNDGNAAYYRRAYAWQDPDGDPEAKSSYKFIHHEVSGDGTIGAANARACITGIAVLNGARGGTTIPDSDRRGVWRHLAAHLNDADTEPPELKSAGAGWIEYRAYPLVEVRANDDGEMTISGHAAVFDELSLSLGPYREKIARGAFAKTIQEADVRALWNHDPNYVLGRVKSGTLGLEEDEKGLAICIAPPDTTWARDLITTLKRGDVDQMSFGFRVIKQDWEGDGEELVRVLREVELFDVSPVTFPAYPQTDVQARSLLRVLRCYFPTEPLLAEHSGRGVRLARRKLELYLKEHES